MGKRPLLDVSSIVPPERLNIRSGGDLAQVALSHDEPAIGAPKKIKRRTLRKPSRPNASELAPAEPLEDSEGDPQAALLTHSVSAKNSRPR